MIAHALFIVNKGCNFIFSPSSFETYILTFLSNYYSGIEKGLKERVTPETLELEKFHSNVIQLKHI